MHFTNASVPVLVTKRSGFGWGTSYFPHTIRKKNAKNRASARVLAHRIIRFSRVSLLDLHCALQFIGNLKNLEPQVLIQGRGAQKLLHQSQGSAGLLAADKGI